MRENDDKERRTAARYTALGHPTALVVEQRTAPVNRLVLESKRFALLDPEIFPECQITFQDPFSPFTSADQSLENEPIALWELECREYSPQPSVNDAQEAVAVDESEPTLDQGTFLMRIAAYEGDIVECKRTTARDLLANERTVLAWVRSSLMYASLSVIIFLAYEENLQKKKKLIESDINILLADGTMDELIQRGAFIKRTIYIISSIAFSLAIICIICGGSRYFMVKRYLLRWNLFPASRASVVVVYIICLVLLGVTIGEFIALYVRLKH
ncbi:hypothetical protein BABINDRAFT_167589 [Babjeviella inositovora NRRL Y-12698]|uniref:DUF202 domain-containing protein n=1 Tax=Babjeviella inositovora NRRL Y-12698 TaxID=984486 RepID=A0A1E3QMY9_9ASCO|nr:uncharacterized protein BABINDRAFT_167589 [Babjeviella inositovora NRRL Y-12698]ODQ79043.1 hypothetical protein BABINDRAFT_167589 [Babjeviella inositovora NRRL Y-12698]